MKTTKKHGAAESNPIIDMPLPDNQKAAAAWLLEHYNTTPFKIRVEYDPYSGKPDVALKYLVSGRIEKLGHLAQRLSMLQEALGFYLDAPDSLVAEAVDHILEQENPDEYRVDITLNMKNKDDRAQLRTYLQNVKDHLIESSSWKGVDGYKCLDGLVLSCELLSSLIFKNMGDNDIFDFTMYEEFLRDCSNEAIGYWTAKLEEMKRNKDGGGNAMKAQGEKNKEAIKTILGAYEIKALGIFRQDKALRKRFMDEAQKKTAEIDTAHNQALSEKRIMDLAREILQEAAIPRG